MIKNEYKEKQIKKNEFMKRVKGYNLLTFISFI